MLDKFFLLYANKLFKDNPKNLKVLFQDFIEQQHSMNKAGGIYNEWNEVRLEFLVDTIGTFSDFSDFDSALKWKDKIKSKAQELFERIPGYLNNIDNYIELALEAVFFYRYGWCDGTWHENGSCIGYRSDQHDFGLDDNIRLKCHECRQLFLGNIVGWS